MANIIVIKGRYPTGNDHIPFEDMELRVKNIAYCKVQGDPPMFLVNVGTMDIETNSTGYADVSREINQP